MILLTRISCQGLLKRPLVQNKQGEPKSRVEVSTGEHPFCISVLSLGRELGGGGEDWNGEELCSKLGSHSPTRSEHLCGMLPDNFALDEPNP